MWRVETGQEAQLDAIFVLLMEHKDVQQLGNKSAITIGFRIIMFCY